MTTTVAHTAELGAERLAQVRALCFASFGEHYDESAWEHALGGMHVLVRRDGVLAAHAAVVLRRLGHDGRWLRTGFVESVAVDPAFRRAGLGTVVMDEVARIVRGGYELGALGSSADGLHLYPRLGWERWRGPLSVLTPAGVRPVPDGAEAVFVLPAGAALHLDGELTCDWRDGEPW